MALIDSKTLKQNFEGDEDILEELVADFRESKSEMIQEIKSSYENQDYETFERAAHTLKGVVSNFYAEQVRSKLSTLESMGKEKKITNFESEIEAISNEIDQVLDEVDQLLKS